MVKGEGSVVENMQFEIGIIVSKFANRLLSERKFSLLRNDSNCSYVQTLLSQAKKCAIVYSNDKQQMVICAADQKELEEAYGIINSNVAVKILGEGKKSGSI